MHEGPLSRCADSTVTLPRSSNGGKWPHGEAGSSQSTGFGGRGAGQQWLSHHSPVSWDSLWSQINQQDQSH